MSRRHEKERGRGSQLNGLQAEPSRHGGSSTTMASEPATGQLMRNVTVPQATIPLTGCTRSDKKVKYGK